MPTKSHDYLLARHDNDPQYALWRFDPHGNTLLERMPLSPDAKFDPKHQIIPIGGRYLLEWGPVGFEAYQASFPYRLFEFDPDSPDPLAAAAVQKGLWAKSKFWYSRPDFGNPDGASKSFESGKVLMLIPMGSFVLNLIPMEGRGTFQLWNFDPNPLAPGQSDPLPVPYTPQGAFDSIAAGHELIPFDNYVLDRVPETGEYHVWSFDPENEFPLARPAIQHGRWQDIDEGHRLSAVGEFVLDWVPADRSYRLWRFDPHSADPLQGPLRSGTLPEGFDAQTTLTGIQALRPVDAERARQPGSLDFMRDKIKHVVYLMLENRSFDHVCGWLYENGQDGVHFVGREGPFDGASTEMFNIAPDKKNGDRKVFLKKYKDGELSDDWSLDFLVTDPYHDHSDVMRQYYFRQPDGYAKHAVPEMGGFVWNNACDNVMWTYGPEQLPVLNGLAKHYAVSDAWFCSMPGATDSNRAFAFSGSALGQLNNFQNGTQYIDWPDAWHRQSIWKVLWANGFTDWKIYNSIEWMGFVHTYHLYLQGQIPSVDANTADYIASIEQFKKDARAGDLPAFSFLEPVWIGSAGTTSYHPGPDVVPGEVALNELFDAMKAGPAWNETLFVITFDEHGGIFDHVSPPRAVNPWPNDVIDGYRFDMMGVRVPTILVSPWIQEKTVFRAAGDTPYDSTSILATLLHWYGIPKAGWAMGDRVNAAPSFEGVFLRDTPREEAPELKPPYDSDFPRKGTPRQDIPLNDLHRLMAPRVVWSLVRGKLSRVEAERIADDILSKATSLKSLHSLLDDLARRFS
ncbi:alkaline phosphatase family protein [Niveibacterium sp. SC-1]|uniref:alkaline phosphatase family protein n=1 Tax=Niveibacterium sp. SC-1 TaxID=3135646 RepID=UPI00311DD0BD